MAASTDVGIGLSAKIELDDGSGGVGSDYGEVIDVISISPPDVLVGVIDRKPLNLANRTILKKAALKDPGEFSFQYEYSKGKKQRLDTLIGTSKHFKITLPDTGSGAFVRIVPGFITSNKIDAVVSDGLMTVTCTVAVEDVSTDS